MEESPLRPVAWDPSQSSVRCLGVSGKASTEWQEAESVVRAGCDGGPAVSYNQEELEVTAQPVSKVRRGQGLAAPTDIASSSLEPATSKAHSGPSMGQRRSKCTKRLRRGPVLHAQHWGTDRRADKSSQDQPEESSAGSFPKLVS